jgi:hypothetical protein
LSARGAPIEENSDDAKARRGAGAPIATAIASISAAQGVAAIRPLIALCIRTVKQ